MRVFAYSARPYQLPFFESAAADLGIEYATTNEPLTEETVHLAQGFDAVTDGAPRDYSEAVFTELRSLGIEYFAIRSAGVDPIDFERAGTCGVRIANVPAYSPNAIAELAVGLTLTLLRNLHLALPRARDGLFVTEGFMGRELRNQTVGIIGTGRIGRVAASVFSGFGAKVIGHDPYPNGEAKEWLEYRDTVQELLQEATVVSLHCPLTAANTHMFDDRAFAQMRSGALLINTARGPLVDNDALYRAVACGHLGGAALDVIDGEERIFGRDHFGQPLPDESVRRLMSLPNVVISPHFAYKTDEAVSNMISISLQNLLEFVQTGECRNEIRSAR